MATPKHKLMPIVQSILNDIIHTANGIRIPKDKFLTWSMILKKQHHHNLRIFLQLGVLGVEFAKSRTAFVSDQFLILAAVGLEPARVGALLDPELVETKVASIFVQKYQQSKGGTNQFSTSQAVAPPGTIKKKAPVKTGEAKKSNYDNTVFIDTNGSTERVSSPYEKSQANSEEKQSKTQASKESSDAAEHDEQAEVTNVYNPHKSNPQESTRLERTPLPKGTRRTRRRKHDDE